MYPYLQSEPKMINLRQQDSLEKHHRMIQNALEWQRVSKMAGDEQKARANTGLKFAWTTVLHLLIGR